MKKIIEYISKKKWILIVSLAGISFLMHYQSGSEERLRSQLRKHLVTIDSKLFVKETKEKHTEKYLCFRVREYPRLNFNVRSFRYSQLNKDILIDVNYGDTLNIWIKSDISSVRIEREVYGIEANGVDYLNINSVLSKKRRSYKARNFILLVLLIFIMISYLLALYNERTKS